QRDLVGGSLSSCAFVTAPPLFRAPSACRLRFGFAQQFAGPSFSDLARFRALGLRGMAMAIRDGGSRQGAKVIPRFRAIRTCMGCRLDSGAAFRILTITKLLRSKRCDRHDDGGVF